MDNKKWMVKTEKGGVYGPVDTETLKEWIKENRVSQKDMITEEGKYEWKKVAEIEEFSSLISSSTSEPVSSGISSETEKENVGKYAVGFGIFNILIGGFMFTGGILPRVKIVSYIQKSNIHSTGLGKIISGAGILGIIITTILWLPLFISGFLILGRKQAGRVLAIKIGEILTWAIPISFFITFGVRKIFSLIGLLAAILLFYIIIMWQNLIKSDFDSYFS